MAQTLIKVIMLLTCINLFLYVGGVRVIDNSALDSIVTVDGSGVSASEDLKGATDFSLRQSGSGLLDFIDSLGAVGDMITWVINLVFTPLGLFTGAGLPADVVLLVGVPILVAGVLGLAYYVRSGS